MLNIDHVDVSDENMWIMPLFLKPGKNEFIIRTPIDQQVEA